jgi:hypothetical protein
MVRFYHFLFASNPAISQNIIYIISKKKIKARIPHKRGARRLQIGPTGLRLALHVVHPVPIIHHFEFLPALWAYLPIHTQNENQLADIHRSSSVRKKSEHDGRDRVREKYRFIYLYIYIYI